MVPGMRPGIAAALLLVTLPCTSLADKLTAQDRPDPQQQLQAKLASPFLKNAPWVTDHDLALRQARKRHTLIFGYFTTAGY